MKRIIKKVFYGVLFLVLFVAVAGGLLYAFYSYRRTNSLALAPTNLPGLREQVTVQLDERGIPYIEANNEADLYFVQGYVTAKDRLWQMDMLRRSGRGELAEILGRGVLEEDKRRRAFGFAQLSEELANNASPEMRQALENYARGVNAFIASREFGTWPVEFTLLQYEPRPWRPADSFIIIKIFADTLGNSWHQDIRRAALADLPPERRQEILPEVSPIDVIVVGSDTPQQPARKAAAALAPPSSPPPTVNAGVLTALAAEQEIHKRTLERIGLHMTGRAISNSWVVSGDRSVTGKPLLANDPHLDASAPSIWYMTHLSAPGLRVAGVTVPGLPGIVIGHNERIAWGISNFVADVQDVYIEHFDPNNPQQYMTPTGLQPATVRREEIKVRDGFVGADTEVVPFEVVETRHGPIIFEENSTRYALHWTALEHQSHELESFYKVNRARGWGEFRDALSKFTGPPMNFTYTDVDGHIGYYGAGRVPIRKTGDGSLVYDGAKDDGAWTGYIPADKLPSAFDPPSGVIVLANQRVVGRDYPYIITREWPDPSRARRIHDLLMSKEKFSADDFRTIQADTYSFADAIFTGEVIKMARPLAASSPEWRHILETFEGWDGRTSADSRPTFLSVAMRVAFQRRLLANVLGSERERHFRWANRDTFIDKMITTRPPEWLPPGFDSYESFLLACYKDAREQLAQTIGPDESQWTWGRSANRRFFHPLSFLPVIGQKFSHPQVPQGTGGSGSTVNAGLAVSMRLIADPSDWDKTRQSLSIGQSGDPASQHWSDQIADWSSVTPRPFPFSQNAVASAAKEKIVFAPGKS